MNEAQPPLTAARRGMHGMGVSHVEFRCANRWNQPPAVAEQPHKNSKAGTESGRSPKWNMKPTTRIMALALGLVFLSSAAHAQKKPNILVIFGDDIGYWNVSA